MKKLISILFLISSVALAQESMEPNTLPLPKLSYLDSLKNTFVSHPTSNCIDERWISELTSTELSQDMYSDISTLHIDAEVSF